MEFPLRPMAPPMSEVFSSWLFRFTTIFFFEFLLLVLWLQALGNLCVFPTGFLFSVLKELFKNVHGFVFIRFIVVVT